jgi:hypothetical protein
MSLSIEAAALAFCQKMGHANSADVGLVAAAVKIERDRCVAIINLARTGEVDTDLRAIRSRIQGGDTPDEIAAERAAG